MRDENAQFLQDEDRDKKSQMTDKKYKNSIQNVSRILIVKVAVLAVFNYILAKLIPFKIVQSIRILLHENVDTN